MILYGHDSLQDILGITATDDNSNRIDWAMAGNGNVGIGEVTCIPLDIVGTVLSFMPSDEQIAIENEFLDRIKRLRDSRLPCKVPNCPKEPIGYGAKEKEGVIDPYCRDHWAYAEDGYYDTLGPW